MHELLVRPALLGSLVLLTTQLFACASESSSANKLNTDASNIVELPVSEQLATPAPNSQSTMNVLVVSFLPTRDGEFIDVQQATGFHELGTIRLSSVIERIDNFNHAGKYMLEEGSRFRGYSDANAAPFLGYQIKRHLLIYEQIPSALAFPINPNASHVRYQPDYHAVFDRFNLGTYINEHEIDEVWLWYGEPATPDFPSFEPELHGDTKAPVGFVESNMSSPTTGDISNSRRFADDLPVLDHTYVVYAHNFRRSQNEMVHNHGHQLEAVLKHAATMQDGTDELFTQKFVGWGANGEPPLGRAGNTHFPVNTTVDYDYRNTTPVASDIEDWRPDGTGASKNLSALYWANLPYQWPEYMALENLAEPGWYVYWMQNMPGYGNTIPYLSPNTYMTNWWIFTADWDYAMSQGIGLHGQLPD